MLEADLEPFATLYAQVCLHISRGQFSPTQADIALVFRACQGNSLAEVRAALDGHMRDPQRGRFVPVAADVVAQLDSLAGNDGRPGPEEAWAIALRAEREQDATVSWTGEIAEALGQVRVILREGDEVGARMAFKEVYAKAIDKARHEREPVHWTHSIGTSSQARLSAPEPAQHNPSVAALPMPDQLRLNGDQLGSIPMAVCAHLRGVADGMRTARAYQPGRDAQAKARTAQQQAATREQVERYAQERGLDLQGQGYARENASA